jgi:hypothetical protein
MMKTYEKYETIMNRPVKKQVHTLSHNTLCSRPACYSNCHINCKLDFSLDPDIFRYCVAMGDGNQCHECKHPSMDHRHYNSIWEDVIDTQIIVDKDAKQKFHAASQDKSRYRDALQKVEASIKDLDGQLESLKIDIGMLCQSYQSLSLSGSFTGQITKMVRLFELTVEAQQMSGADAKTIAVMENNIEMMRQKQKIVDEASAAVQSSVCVVEPAQLPVQQGLVASAASRVYHALRPGWAS